MQVHDTSVNDTSVKSARLGRQGRQVQQEIAASRLDSLLLCEENLSRAEGLVERWSSPGSSLEQWQRNFLRQYALISAQQDWQQETYQGHKGHSSLLNRKMERAETIARKMQERAGPEHNRLNEPSEQAGLQSVAIQRRKNKGFLRFLLKPYNDARLAQLPSLLETYIAKDRGGWEKDITPCVDSVRQGISSGQLPENAFFAMNRDALAAYILENMGLRNKEFYKTPLKARLSFLDSRDPLPRIYCRHLKEVLLAPFRTQ